MDLQNLKTNYSRFTAIRISVKTYLSIYNVVYTTASCLDFVNLSNVLVTQTLKFFFFPSCISECDGK